MQSGHGLGGKRAGIDLGNSSDRESIFYINGITDGISVTENIMDKFLKKMTTDNTLYIAEKWVEAVAEIIRDH